MRNIKLRNLNHKKASRIYRTSAGYKKNFSKYEPFCYS